MTHGRMTMRVTAGLLVCAVLSLAGCGGPKPYIRADFLEHPPRRVAVLPFVITYDYDMTDGQSIPPSHVVGRELFRKTFYYSLTPYGFEDLPLEEVDAALTAAWGPIDAGIRQAVMTSSIYRGVKITIEVRHRFT